MADASAPSQTYEASCHCGAIRFAATVSPPLDSGHEVTSCNCSICARNGSLWVYLADDKIKFESGEGEAKVNTAFVKCGERPDWQADGAATQGYRFGEKKIEHCSCPTCSTSVYSYSIKPGFFDGMKAVNVRTFKDVDIDALKIKKVDGKAA
ncbi:putative glutathione-dependent formaldehyde-activating protein [Neofusicoccum parvum UCRNP2]|uniref:Putative glutathione-dependent formaldehyde-activating protein n=1 Tax=Botryosphaeria parva (strain UCR-NP2) TaxID=1287680 RepID=R1GMU1_BOTPV|nr:putative glutathione-dependent formaldehyde-activating protein [Neofusicoccum parvum UCRNP2]